MKINETTFRLTELSVGDITFSSVNLIHPNVTGPITMKTLTGFVIGTFDDMTTIESNIISSTGELDVEFYDTNDVVITTPDYDITNPDNEVITCTYQLIYFLNP